MRYTRDTDNLILTYESEREFEILKKYLDSRMNGAGFWKHIRKDSEVHIPLQYNFTTSQIMDGMKIVELTERAEEAEAKLAEIKSIWWMDDPEVVATELNRIFGEEEVLN